MSKGTTGQDYFRVKRWATGVGQQLPREIRKRGTEGTSGNDARSSEVAGGRLWHPRQSRPPLRNLRELRPSRSPTSPNPRARRNMRPSEELYVASPCQRRPGQKRPRALARTKAHTRSPSCELPQCMGSTRAAGAPARPRWRVCQAEHGPSCAGAPPFASGGQKQHSGCPEAKEPSDEQL